MSARVTSTASLDALGVLVDYTVPGGSAAPVYDDNGNLTSDGTYGNRTYTYDALGRLTDVVGNGTTAHYSLDGAGLRRSETVNGLTTSFDLDLAAANPTILADGTRTYLPADPSAGYEAAGTWWNNLATAQGSPISAVSTTGATTAPVHLDPYGAARPGSTVAAGIGYGGEWSDPSGLINLRARAYDPSSGRFTSRDSFAGYAGLPQTANRYGYGLANPLTYTDPSGHFVNFAISHPGLAVELVGAYLFPEVAVAYLVGCALVGYDPLLGISLSGLERLFYGLPFMGKAVGVLGRVLKATFIEARLLRTVGAGARLAGRTRGRGRCGRAGGSRGRD